MSAYPAHGHLPDQRFVPGEELADFRARIRAADQERTAQRRRDLAAQGSDQNSPALRIRMWERLHHAHLPGDAQHGLVAVIAAGTKLTVDEVRAEQERRRAVPAAIPAPVPMADPQP
jgi:hypothetical protein